MFTFSQIQSPLYTVILKCYFHDSMKPNGIFDAFEVCPVLYPTSSTLTLGGLTKDNRIAPLQPSLV